MSLTVCTLSNLWSCSTQVFSHDKLKSVLDGLSVHLVEASPALSSVQYHTLTGHTDHTPTDSQPVASDDNLPANPYKTCQLEDHGGVEVSWWRKLEDVPKGW